jgi:hypothetical protein
MFCVGLTPGFGESLKEAQPSARSRLDIKEKEDREEEEETATEKRKEIFDETECRTRTSW